MKYEKIGIYIFFNELVQKLYPNENAKICTKSFFEDPPPENTSGGRQIFRKGLVNTVEGSGVKGFCSGGSRILFGG